MFYLEDEVYFPEIKDARWKQLEKCKVTFYPMGKVIEVNKGENLLNAARKAGINIDAPCGGKGSCGKCRVIVEEGQVTTQPTTELTPEEKSRGYYLACLTTVESDLVVKVPIESLVETLKIVDAVEMKKKRHDVLESGFKERILGQGLTLSPNVKKVYLQLDHPTLDDNISDLERVKRALRTQAGINDVYCTIFVVRKMANVLRKNDWKVTLTLTDANSNLEIIKIEGGDTTNKLYGLAIDIGTTSVAACLVNLLDGTVIESSSAYNAQVTCGADVITRIIYAGKEEGRGLAKLRQLVVKSINELILDMSTKAGIDSEEICSIVASGNTTMTQMFLAADPQYIRLEPYIPTIDHCPPAKAANFFLKVNPEAYVFCAPNVASYVGGDITAGALAAGLWHSEAITLFIDLGTNGEIVFGNQDWLMTCACSAGPAFEGGEITHGMRAASGAIDHIKIDRQTFEPTYTIIGEGKPKGICGSGLIDAMSEMLLAGIMNRKGKINRELNISRIRVDEESDLAEYVLAWANETETNRDITLSEVDIDNFIRAKGAVYSGCATLVNSMGMDFSMVEKVLIAGGIGSHLAIEQSVIIGLLPDLPHDRFNFIGNSSLTGSYLILLCQELKNKVGEIADQMTYVELSVYPGYMDEFISSLFLPHTDLESFPFVKDLLGE